MLKEYFVNHVRRNYNEHADFMAACESLRDLRQVTGLKINARKCRFKTALSGIIINVNLSDLTRGTN